MKTMFRNLGITAIVAVMALGLAVSCDTGNGDQTNNDPPAIDPLMALNGLDQARLRWGRMSLQRRRTR